MNQFMLNHTKHYNQELETGFLGSILLNEPFRNYIFNLNILTSEDFYFINNKKCKNLLKYL